MSSKAFFSSVRPKLYKRLPSIGQENNVSLELWTTTCIVTNFRHANCTILVNPANPNLSGTSQFPYFPRGGPVPKDTPSNTTHRDWQPLGYVSQWGGMEVGRGMMFPVSVIDGLVHLYGGWKLQLECRLQQSCPVGTAVRTSAGNDRLAEYYQYVIHTAPPFYQDEQSREKLIQCYQSVFRQVDNVMLEERRVAVPLIGSGCRGFPHEIAMEAAVEALLSESTRRLDTQGPPIDVVFGFLELEHAKQMSDILQGTITATRSLKQI